MIPTASKRAAHGARMLDYAWPGWHREIDLGSLDLIDCHDCALGQLYGSFDSARYHLGLDQTAAIAYGFYLDTWFRSYRALTRAWTREIQMRMVLDVVNARPHVNGPGHTGAVHDELADFPGQLVGV